MGWGCEISLNETGCTLETEFELLKVLRVIVVAAVFEED